MNFYERFCDVCKKRGISPSKAALEAGISKSLVSKWKSNPETSPNIDTVMQLAEYFKISLDELVYGTKATNVYEERELDRFRDLLRFRPECRRLLFFAEISSPAQVEAYSMLIETARSIAEDCKKK